MSAANDVTLLSLVESFFRVRLIQVGGVSPQTVRAYRDALRLLFKFLSQWKKCAVSDLTLDDLNVEAIIAFLGHLERERSNKITSRNARLAAIRSFFHHLIDKDPLHAGEYERVLSLESKQSPIEPPEYLEPQEVKQLLAQPDRSTVDGRRDYALMLFLYNTGARISAALGVCVENLSLTPPRQVKLFGKGGKQRLCPLWKETAHALAQLPSVRNGQSADRIFYNHTGGALTRDGAAYLLRKYKAMAVRLLPALRNRRISPHVLRHSCAVALLQAGVDLTVIRDYLGHASIETTNRYVSANLKMKRETLSRFWRKSGLSPARAKWAPKADVLELLESM
jgi:site-specific recombinase XerD